MKKTEEKEKEKHTGRRSIHKKRFPGRKHSLTCAGGNHRKRRRSREQDEVRAKNLQQTTQLQKEAHH